MKENKKRRSGILLNILSLLLAVIGLVLIFQQPIRDFILSQQIASQESLLQNVTAEEVEKNKAEEVTFNFEDVRSLSLASVLEEGMSAAKVKSIGEIAIPSVGINLNIAKGVSDLNMSVGAGTLRPDQEMGKNNYPLASHYTNAGDGTLLFTPLHQIQIGAKVYLTDLTNVYVYDVYWKEYVEETRVDLVYETTDESIITLITCEDLSATRRLAVRGRLSATYPVGEAPQEAIEAFKIMSKTLY